MKGIKMAKRSVAVKACKLLYERGELDDHLLPINKKRHLQHVSEIYFKHWNKYTEGKIILGSKSFPKYLLTLNFYVHFKQMIELPVHGKKSEAMTLSFRNAFNIQHRKQIKCATFIIY